MAVSSAHKVRVLLEGLGTVDAAAKSYQTVKDTLKVYSPAEIRAMVEQAGLRGRGGAGFPAGVKWQMVASQEDRERYIVANGAEGEPGCFKDRYLMKNLPHRVVSGMIIAAYAVGARKGYIYIHHEAHDCMSAIGDALVAARRDGILGDDILGTGFSLELQVHTAGAGYVAGEETAVIRCIQGEPPKPKAKPPYPSVKGLGGHPTLVNNVETLTHVEVIARNGVEWYRGLGTEDTPGTLLVSLHGVRRPGVYEIEAGVSIREVINRMGGGVRGKIMAVLPGGYSSAFLGPDALDVPLEYGALRERGSSLGVANVHVFDDGQCIVDATRKIMKFFAAETCGQCFPCHKGTREYYQLLEEAERGVAREDWEKTLQAVYQLTGRKTICGLDKSATIALRSAMKAFPEEFERHLRRDIEQNCDCGAVSH